MSTIIIAYIGIAQAIFTICLLFKKKATNIPDRILSIWMFGLALLYGLDIIKGYRQITEMLWPISINISLTFPPLLFLYSKYIIKKHTCFEKIDYLHFTPSVIGIIIITLSYSFCSSNIYNFLSYAEFYNQMIPLRDIYSDALYFSVWIYVTLTLIRIYNYKKQLVNTYSFESAKISLNWLLFIAIFYLIFFHYTIIIAILQINKFTINYIEDLGSPMSLLIIYVLSYYGLKQELLNQEKIYTTPVLNKNLENCDHSNDRYTKSGLKKHQANIYLEQLIIFIEKSEAWKDPELSIAKLSEQTNIPRHYITQTLNEHLHKNFYTFVNEYRIEYAMKLIRSDQYKNWSFLAIAYESGFNSKTAFNNFFKKHTQMTPSEFKNSIKIEK